MLKLVKVSTWYEYDPLICIPCPCGPKRNKYPGNITDRDIFESGPEDVIVVSDEDDM